MKPLIVVTSFIFTATLGMTAQGVQQELQQKLAAVKQSLARNQEALRDYTWTQHTEISLNGQLKKTKDEMCRYGPDGTVQKTSAGPPSPQMEMRGIRGRIAEKKKDELEGYMERASALIHSYIPPSQQSVEQAFRAGNASLGQAGPGTIQLQFRNYLKPGDSLTVSFSEAAKVLREITVTSWLDDPKDAVSLQVDFQTLPDGTNYAATTILTASAKHVQVKTQNSGYQRVGA
jgi:hypothetical protein